MSAREVYNDWLGRYRSSHTDDGRISEEVGVDLDANVISIVRKYNGDVVQDAEIVLNGGMISDIFDASSPLSSLLVATITYHRRKKNSATPPVQE